MHKLLVSGLLPVSFTVWASNFCRCIDGHFASPVACQRKEQRIINCVTLSHFVANRPWMLNAPFLMKAQQRTFLKLWEKENILWTKEIVEEAFSVVSWVMLILWLRLNGTQRPNIWRCERLYMKCYYCHNDDWMHVEITFTGIATDGLCIFPSYSFKALKAAFLINQKQASHIRAERNNLSMPALLWMKC